MKVSTFFGEFSKEDLSGMLQKLTEALYEIADATVSIRKALEEMNRLEWIRAPKEREEKIRKIDDLVSHAFWIVCDVFGDCTACPLSKYCDTDFCYSGSACSSCRIARRCISELEAETGKGNILLHFLEELRKGKE
jgi:hypothetical protein